jgi:EAL domain-containing protein (putative c-di-GMP-specific phosphodiesterase class I)
MAVDGTDDELERTLRELAAFANAGRRVAGPPAEPSLTPAAGRGPAAERVPAAERAPAERVPPTDPVDGALSDADTPDRTASQLGADEAPEETSLELWYQPKIDLRQKCLAGAEALVRISHPRHGLLAPESLLDVGDDSFARLTEHALLTVLSDWEKFDQAGFNLRLAINLPFDHLLRLPIEAIVGEHRPSAAHWPGLIVEVSEDEIVRDIKCVQDIALALHQSSIAVAIDNFGAGYSSFSTLGELPFAELKLNREFVQNCAADSTNAAICQTVIELAHRFGSAAVAQGIETMADLQALQVMGCDFGQGVLLAPAMPRDRFIEMLQQRMNRPRMASSAKAAATAAIAAANR